MKQKVYKINPNNRIVLAYVVDNMYFRCKDSSGNISEVLCEEVLSHQRFESREIRVTW